MKTLQLVVCGLVRLGLGPHQLKQTYPINKKSMKAFFVLLFGLILSLAYLLLEARTFEDYTLSLYVCITVLLGIIGYVILMWKNRPICKLIDNIEKTIDDSE